MPIAKRTVINALRRRGQATLADQFNRPPLNTPAYNDIAGGPDSQDILGPLVDTDEDADRLVDLFITRMANTGDTLAHSRNLLGNVLGITNPDAQLVCPALRANTVAAKIKGDARLETYFGKGTASTYRMLDQVVHRNNNATDQKADDVGNNTQATWRDEIVINIQTDPAMRLGVVLNELNKIGLDSVGTAIWNSRGAAGAKKELLTYLDTHEPEGLIDSVVTAMSSVATPAAMPVAIARALHITTSGPAALAAITAPVEQGLARAELVTRTLRKAGLEGIADQLFPVGNPARDAMAVYLQTHPIPANLAQQITALETALITAGNNNHLAVQTAFATFLANLVGTPANTATAAALITDDNLANLAVGAARLQELPVKLLKNYVDSHPDQKVILQKVGGWDNSGANSWQANLTNTIQGIADTDLSGRALPANINLLLGVTPNNRNKLLNYLPVEGSPSAERFDLTRARQVAGERRLQEMKQDKTPLMQWINNHPDKTTIYERIGGWGIHPTNPGSWKPNLLAIQKSMREFDLSRGIGNFGQLLGDGAPNLLLATEPGHPKAVGHPNTKDITLKEAKEMVGCERLREALKNKLHQPFHEWLTELPSVKQSEMFETIGGWRPADSTANLNALCKGLRDINFSSNQPDPIKAFEDLVFNGKLIAGPAPVIPAPNTAAYKATLTKIVGAERVATLPKTLASLSDWIKVQPQPQQDQIFAQVGAMSPLAWERNKTDMLSRLANYPLPATAPLGPDFNEILIGKKQLLTSLPPRTTSGITLPIAQNMVGGARLNEIVTALPRLERWFSNGHEQERREAIANFAGWSPEEWLERKPIILNHFKNSNGNRRLEEGLGNGIVLPSGQRIGVVGTPVTHTLRGTALHTFAKCGPLVNEATLDEYAKKEPVLVEWFHANSTRLKEVRDTLKGCLTYTQKITYLDTLSTAIKNAANTPQIYVALNAAHANPPNLSLLRNPVEDQKRTNPPYKLTEAEARYLNAMSGVNADRVELHALLRVHRDEVLKKFASANTADHDAAKNAIIWLAHGAIDKLTLSQVMDHLEALGISPKPGTSPADDDAAYNLRKSYAQSIMGDKRRLEILNEARNANHTVLEQLLTNPPYPVTVQAINEHIGQNYLHGGYNNLGKELTVPKHVMTWDELNRCLRQIHPGLASHDAYNLKSAALKKMEGVEDKRFAYQGIEHRGFRTLLEKTANGPQLTPVQIKRINDLFRGLVSVPPSCATAGDINVALEGIHPGLGDILCDNAGALTKLALSISRLSDQAQISTPTHANHFNRIKSCSEPAVALDGLSRTPTLCKFLLEQGVPITNAQAQHIRINNTFLKPPPAPPPPPHPVINRNAAGIVKVIKYTLDKNPNDRTALERCLNTDLGLAVEISEEMYQRIQNEYHGYFLDEATQNGFINRADKIFGQLKQLIKSRDYRIDANLLGDSVNLTPNEALTKRMQQVDELLAPGAKPEDVLGNFGKRVDDHAVEKVKQVKSEVLSLRNDLQTQLEHARKTLELCAVFRNCLGGEKTLPALKTHFTGLGLSVSDVEKRIEAIKQQRDILNKFEGVVIGEINTIKAKLKRFDPLLGEIEKAQKDVEKFRTDNPNCTQISVAPASYHYDGNGNIKNSTNRADPATFSALQAKINGPLTLAVAVPLPLLSAGEELKAGEKRVHDFSSTASEIAVVEERSTRTPSQKHFSVLGTVKDKELAAKQLAAQVAAGVGTSQVTLYNSGDVEADKARYINLRARGFDVDNLSSFQLEKYYNSGFAGKFRTLTLNQCIKEVDKEINAMEKTLSSTPSSSSIALDKGSRFSELSNEIKSNAVKQEKAMNSVRLSK